MNYLNNVTDDITSILSVLKLRTKLLACFVFRIKMPYVYVGHAHGFAKGKTLWEIIGNLKNFGVGRIFTRDIYKYPEPTYFKVVKVEPVQSPPVITYDDVRPVRVWAERTFRGVKSISLELFDKNSISFDFQLIPKDKEAAFCKWDGPVHQMKVLPRTMDFPPLLRELILRERTPEERLKNEEPKMEVVYKVTADVQKYRLADEGETPTIEVTPALGTPDAPRLYKGIKL